MAVTAGQIREAIARFDDSDEINIEVEASGSCVGFVERVFVDSIGGVVFEI